LVWVVLIYAISVVSWGSIFFQLVKLLISTSKGNRPSLLFPLTIASLALFIESLFFGVSAFFSMMGNDNVFAFMREPQNWFLVKILIAISGVLLLFDIKAETKQKKGGNKNDTKN
jgi:uncharacterized membrane protein